MFVVFLVCSLLSLFLCCCLCLFVVCVYLLSVFVCCCVCMFVVVFNSFVVVSNLFVVVFNWFFGFLYLFSCLCLFACCCLCLSLVVFVCFIVRGCIHPTQHKSKFWLCDLGGVAVEKYENFCAIQWGCGENNYFPKGRRPSMKRNCFKSVALGLVKVYKVGCKAGQH